MEYCNRAMYQKMCKMVTLKEEAVKQLNLIYQVMPNKLEILNEQITPQHTYPDPLHYSTEKKDVLEIWLNKWEVMAYLKISKTTYYRWRKEGKLVPRTSVGEDRYLLDDVKNILKKRIT